MSREFPDFIDPWRAAAGGRRIGGTLPLVRLKRLNPLLASSEGEAAFELLFGIDEQRRAKVHVSVSAPLKLVCQRSLEPFTQEVEQRSALLIIADSEEQALLSDGEEFIQVESGRIAVADLVEDELLLAVPQVPRNPAVGAVWATTASEKASKTENGGASIRQQDRKHGESGASDRHRPFESLAELMKNK